MAEKIGEEYLIPILGVWDKFEDIDFKSLPERFVLKTTHASANIVIVKDKNNFNKKKYALFSSVGFRKIDSDEYDFKIGEMWKLPIK